MSTWFHRAWSALERSGRWLLLADWFAAMAVEHR
jgi:hypothetical protein